MSEIKQESEIKKLIQDQVRLFHHKCMLVLSHLGRSAPDLFHPVVSVFNLYLTLYLKDLVSDPEDEDFQADTEELEEASLTEASSADEAESGEDEDFDVQVINNQFQKLKFNAKEAQEDDEEVDSKVIFWSLDSK